MEKIKFDNKLNYIPIILLIFYPASLVAGPFVAEILMNLINLFYLHKIFKTKNFSFTKHKFFLFFIFFYLYIFITIIFSNYIEEIYLKHIFYIRHILFVFAVLDLLKSNKTLIFLFYKFFLATILIVSIDGIFQFFFDYNLIGYEKIREDRLTGFFGDKMIVGSFLSRLLPLFLSLYIFLYKTLSLKINICSLITLIFCFLTIMLSGERMAFYTICLYVILVFILINSPIKFKFYFITSILVIVFVGLFFNKTLINRYYEQTINQINFKFDDENFFSNFVFYKNIYQTAYNGYIDKKIIGQGPRSFRYFCKDDKFSVLSKNSYVVHFDDINADVILVEDIFIKKGDIFKKNQKIFSYKLNDQLFEYRLKKDPTASHLNLTVNSYNLSDKYKKKEIIPKNYFIEFIAPSDGCTTHPHNFYLQALSELGLIGFLFILLLFVYLNLLLLKHLYFSIILKRKTLNNFEISLLLGFMVMLIPVIPNGNLFNNWLNMVMFLPVGFYIYLSTQNK